MAATYPRNDEDVNRVSWHLAYEFRMLRLSARRLAGANPGDSRNAYLESFGMHARSLVAFFHRKPKDDDVSVTHFVRALHTWDRSNIAPSLEPVWDRVSHEMMHLTYKRLIGEPEEKEWDCGAILAALEATLDKFLQIADDRLLARDMLKGRAPGTRADPIRIDTASSLLFGATNLSPVTLPGAPVAELLP